MSCSRKNWAALSSLARQRTLEDEEEQARERRRRDRQLSSTTDPEEEAPSPAPRDTKLALDRLRSLEEAEPPTAATAEEAVPERKVEVVRRPPGIRRQRRQVESSGNISQKKEELENCREPDPGASRLEAALPQSSAQDGKAQPGFGPQGAALDPRGTKAEQCPESAPEQKVLTGEQQGGAAQDEKDLRADEPSGEPVAVRDQPQQSVQERRDRSHLEVKIQCRASSHVQPKPGSLATCPASQQGTARTPLQAQESAGAPASQDKPEDSSVTSPTQVTYSTSFKRVSHRTVSFRVISRKEQEDNAFTRSASMRLPANSIRIAEKYTSAVQRSEGKSPVPLPRSFLPSSEGVASKRSIFEAGALGKTDPAPARKENLRLPGMVTSRINLWISKTQEPSQDGRTKDTGKTDGVPRHGAWAKQPGDSSSNTRL